MSENCLFLSFSLKTGIIGRFAHIIINGNAQKNLFNKDWTLKIFLEFKIKFWNYMILLIKLCKTSCIYTLYVLFGCS